MSPHDRLVIRRLGRDELPADTVALARFLVGRTLVRETEEGRLSGRIIETEAYPVGDSSSHAYRGETRRNRSMFLERGHAYVYIAYGCWPVLNVASEARDIGAGVLLRALEPLEGIDAMGANRNGARLQDLARGPGRLAAALRISLRDDGNDLCGPGALWLGSAAREPDESPRGIIATTRIGITKEAGRPLRFLERGNRLVSGPRRALTS